MNNFSWTWTGAHLVVTYSHCSLNLIPGSQDYGIWCSIQSYSLEQSFFIKILDLGLHMVLLTVLQGTLVVLFKFTALVVLLSGKYIAGGSSLGKLIALLSLLLSVLFCWWLVWLSQTMLSISLKTNKKLNLKFKTL